MNAGDAIKIIECPRDAMQGWDKWIPTEQKIAYLNALLQVGFDTIDFGSFVSHKAIPQMADTKEVLAELDTKNSTSKLLAIVANQRGAEEALQFSSIDYLGFPFSISSTFQLRNTNSTIEASLERVKSIHQLCHQHNKQLVVYLSMAFGNPYGDEYHEGILKKWADAMMNMGITIISLADTVGLATAQQVRTACETMLSAYPEMEVGVHLHSASSNWQDKLSAAYEAGCRRFDGALNGVGGCPMAGNELVGNMDTRLMLDFFKKHEATVSIDEAALEIAVAFANRLFV